MTLPKAMKALQLRRLGRLELVDLPLPSPGPEEVLVRTEATTICTSDLSDIAENLFNAPMPRVLGHEGAGTVAAVGERVSGLRPGQRIAAHPVIPCRSCANCTRGLGHLCLQMGHLGQDRDGTFAEFFCIRADRVRPAPDGLDMAAAALVEPAAVCIESIKRVRVCQGETVLIAGDGPFGILTTRLLLHLQPQKVILVGHHDFRLQQAPEAVRIHRKRTPDVLDAIMKETGGVGVDAAILCVASQEALDMCLSSLRARGRLAVFSPIGGRPTVDLLRLLVRELEILGACNDEDYFDEALGRLADPRLRLDTLVTHRIAFSHWERAFELAASGKDEALKVALVFGETT